MGKIFLVKEQINGYMKAKETSMRELWDLLMPNPFEQYNIERVL